MNDRHEDERYTSLVGHFGELVAEWHQHRNMVTRALGLLSHELLELRDYLRKDEAARIERQKQLDAQLAELAGELGREIQAIRRNQRLWLRVVVIVALVGAGLMAGWLFL